MITSIDIQNFQSIRSANLTLGDLTVIVGPSSSGKSAFLRAVRAVVSNIRGSDYVSRGSKTSSILVEFEDCSISLERGNGVGRYEVKVPGAKAEAYTKLNGGVPEDVTNILKVNPELCFAHQFDSPYLLTESGSMVARALGELSSVSTIFSAAREGRRLQLGAQSTLKLRTADLEALVTKAQEFKTLGSDLKRCSEAESYLSKAEELSMKISRLQELISRQGIAEQVLSQAVVPETPSLDTIVEAYNKWNACKNLVQELHQAHQSTHTAGGLASRRLGEEGELESQLHDLLEAAGVCPVCKSEIGSK